MIYVIENDRTQKHFIPADTEKQAVELYDEFYWTIRDTGLKVRTLDDYIENTDTPERYVLERVREDVIDFVITEIRFLLAEEFDVNDAGETQCDKELQSLSERIAKEQLKPPYDINVRLFAEQIVKQAEEMYAKEGA